MTSIRLLLAALLLASTIPAGAQSSSAPAPAETPKPTVSCPCDSPRFKPLTDKALAVVEYWSARRKLKLTAGFSGIFLLFGVATRDPRAVNEAQDAYSKAGADLAAARTKAESLDALRVGGDDLDGPIEFRIKEGTDYLLTR